MACPVRLPLFLISAALAALNGVWIRARVWRPRRGAGVLPRCSTYCASLPPRRGGRRRLILHSPRGPARRFGLLLLPCLPGCPPCASRCCAFSGLRAGSPAGFFAVPRCGLQPVLSRWFALAAAVLCSLRGYLRARDPLGLGWWPWCAAPALRCGLAFPGPVRGGLFWVLCLVRRWVRSWRSIDRGVRCGFRRLGSLGARVVMAGALTFARVLGSFWLRGVAVRVTPAAGCARFLRRCSCARWRAPSWVGGWP